jgi:hypothetical protein
MREEPDFVAYFRHATRANWASCPWGPRPRRAGPAYRSGRPGYSLVPEPAHLPAGWVRALRCAGTRRGRRCCGRWPRSGRFRHSPGHAGNGVRKTDAGISTCYDERLVPAALRLIGDGLRRQLAGDTAVLERQPASSSPRALDQRIPAPAQYLHRPLNMLQAELLQRNEGPAGAGRAL